MLLVRFAGDWIRSLDLLDVSFRDIHNVIEGEMLIQSPFPNSICTRLSFATDRGQLNMDSLCDWSNYVETWQMSPKCDECRFDGFKEVISTGVEESNSSITGVEHSRTCSLSAVNNMYDTSESKGYCYVYKRRKLRRITKALLPKENATENSLKSDSYHSTIGTVDQSVIVPNQDSERSPATFVCSNVTLDNRNPSNSGWNHLQETSNVLSSQFNEIRNLESAPNIVHKNRGSIVEEVHVESSVRNLSKTELEHYSGTDDSCSSSISNKQQGSTLMKTELKENGECSSVTVLAEPLEKFTSAEDLCVTVLKRHGLLGGVWATDTSSLEALSVHDGNCSQACKICSCLGNPLKMLICDLCEEAFHMSCCNPRVKKVPIDEWYCQSCFRSKPKPVLKNKTEKSFNIVGEMSEKSRNVPYTDLDRISLMLRDNQPHTTGSRIGEVFQAEVPDWSGPIYVDYNYFDGAPELDPAEFASSNGLNCSQQYKSSSIGNWVQCREEIHNGGNDKNEGTVCGKWRRVPLDVVQTDDWDCSCVLPWDPIHADCAVPQALETAVVLEHIKYIETLRSRLANNNKQKTRTE